MASKAIFSNVNINTQEMQSINYCCYGNTAGRLLT